MDFADKQIDCVDCHQPFTFTAGEQRWYKEKGFEREPRRCADCRKARKGSDGEQGRGHGGYGGGHGGGHSGGRGRSDRQRYQVTCTQCGASAEVPFQPRPGSPVYCSTCYQSRRG